MLARSTLILLFCFASLIPPVNAAPLDPFYNTASANGLSESWKPKTSTDFFETDQVFLFLDSSSGVTFDGWVSTPYSQGKNGSNGIEPIIWNHDATLYPNTQLSASGSQFGVIRATYGHFEVGVSDNTQSFSLEYAFLLNGAVVGSGTGYWDGSLGEWANWDGAFDPANLDNLHTPISGTVWLMASGILALVGIRRGKPLRRN